MLQAKLCCLYRTKTKGKTINQEKVNYFCRNIVLYRLQTIYSILDYEKDIQLISLVGPYVKRHGTGDCVRPYQCKRRTYCYLFRY